MTFPAIISSLPNYTTSLHFRAIGNFKQTVFFGKYGIFLTSNLVLFNGSCYMDKKYLVNFYQSIYIIIIHEY